MKNKILLLLLAAMVGGLNNLHAQTAFTYQGKLVDDCCPATGLYDLTFKVFDTAGPGGGGQQGATLPLVAVPVTNGLFTVSLDFGSSVFTGARRWLQIDVRTNSAMPPASFVTLAPRTELTPTPYAIRASIATTVPDGSITAPKIPAGQVVKSLNGLTDAINLVAGANVTLTPSGNNLQIAAPGGSLSLPYRGFGSASPLFALTNAAAGVAIWGESIGGNGRGIFGKGDYGVWGESASTGGRGLIGQVSSDSTAVAVIGNHTAYGNTGKLGTGSEGVYGISAGVGGGNGVAGYNTAFFNGVGVYGEHTQSGNYGSLGYPVRGVFGRAAQTDSVGVEGTHAPSGNYGYLGTANYGVYGRGAADRYGVGADSDGPTGQAIRAVHTSSGNSGVLGTATHAGLFQGSVQVNGNLTTCVLTITGGCDLAEPFQMSGENIPPGSVVIIDEENPGHLKQATRAYDTRVAGIVSGANGVKPGIALHQEGVLEGGQNVALTGRVYVKVDASFGAIKPGDLLTTSDTPGHAMKVTDSTKAQGAILGKAMTALREGTGMVLVLVSLQ